MKTMRVKALTALFLLCGGAAAADTGAWATTSHRLNIVNQAFYLGFESCDHQDLTVEFDPPAGYGPDWWEEVAIQESGKRMLDQGGLTMHFTRPVGAGENCDSDGTRRDLPPCLSIDPIRVDKYLAVTAQVPAIFNAEENQWQKMDCNSPEIGELTDLSQLQIVEHKVPMRVRRYLGIPDRVIAWFEEPLMRDCEYRIYLWLGPMNEEKRCLAEAKDQHFWVIADDLSPFQRETHRRKYDPKTFQLLGFSIKSGYTESAGEMWVSYGKDIGLGLRPGVYFRNKNKMVLAPESVRPAPGDPNRQSSFWQQTYQGLPVEWAGMNVLEKDGNVESATGRIVGGLNLNFDPNTFLAEAAALSHAKNAIGAQQYLWEWAPQKFTIPKGELVLFSSDLSMKPESFVPAWRFRIASHIPPDSQTVYVDTLDSGGKILQRFSNIQGYDYPTGFSADESSWTQWDDILSTGLIEYEGVRNDFKVGRVKISGNTGEATYYALINKGPLIIQTVRYVGGAGPIEESLESVVDPEINMDTGANIFDAPNQTAEVTVHRTVQKVVDYVKTHFNQEEDFYQFFDRYGIDRILSVVTDVQSRIGGLMSAFAPKGALVQDYPSLWFSKAEPGYNPGVSQDVVAHEMFHLFVQLFHPSRSFPPSASMEGFADVFGTLFEFNFREKLNDEKLGFGDWCFADEVDPYDTCDNNLGDPAANGMPTTFGSDNFKTWVQTCGHTTERCATEAMRTLTGHAFYLMVNGSGGEKNNQLGCLYDVAPLDAVQKTSRQLAEHVLLDTVLEGLGGYFDLYAAREATIQAAERIVDRFAQDGATSKLVQTVTDAWYAVGVGNPYQQVDREFSPELGSEDAEPWWTQIKMDVPSGTEWRVQVATDPDFTENVQHKDVGIFETPTDPAKVTAGLRVARVDFDLMSKRRYYWRARQHTEEGAWDQCSPVRFFKTASKAPDITEPHPGATALGGGERVRMIYPWGGTIGGPAVLNASEYFIKVAESADAGCNPTSSANTGMERIVPATTGGFSTSFDLHADQDYYIFARANGPAPAKIPGDCSNNDVGIKIRTEIPPAPALVQPTNANWSIPYGATSLEWAPVKGAIEYQITIYPKDTPAQAQIFNIEAPSSGNGKYTLMPAAETKGQNGICWKVKAIGPLRDEGKESPESCFAWGPTQPRIDSPTNGLTGVDYNVPPTLQWTNDYAPGGYQVELRWTDATGSHSVPQHVDHQAGITTYFWNTPVGLSPSTTYTYLVMALNALNPSDQKSATASFTTRAPPIVCGDGKVEAGEECDDGNLANDDGCDSTCKKEACDNRDLGEAQVTATIPQCYWMDTIRDCVVPSKSVAFQWGAVSGAKGYQVDITGCCGPINPVTGFPSPKVWKTSATGTQSSPITLPGSYDVYIVNVRAINECDEPGGIEGLGVGFYVLP